MAAGATAAMFGASRCGTTAGIARHRAAVTGGNGGGEDGKLFDQLLRAALRTGGLAFPLGGADELFKIFYALRAMKFVEWHEVNLTGFLLAVQ